LGASSSYGELLIGRNGFAGQFEPHGQDFLYRKSFKGAPILVNAAERDRFVNAYNKAQKITVFYGVAVLIIGVIVMMMLYPSNRSAPVWADIVPVGLAGVVIFAMTFWNWNAPARALRGRGTMGEAKTAAEARREALARTSYRQFALAAGIGAFLLFQVGLSGWNRFWLAWAALLIVGAALQAYRKWRLDRSKAEA